MCTRWENFLRIGITVLYLKSCRCQLWIWRSQISVLLGPLRVASKTAFATIKSTTDTFNSSNTVLLFLNWSRLDRYYQHYPIFCFLFINESEKTSIKKTIAKLNELTVCRIFFPRWPYLTMGYYDYQKPLNWSNQDCLWIPIVWSLYICCILLALQVTFYEKKV